MPVFFNKGFCDSQNNLVIDKTIYTQGPRTCSDGFYCTAQPSTGHEVCSVVIELHMCKASVTTYHSEQHSSQHGA